MRYHYLYIYLLLIYNNIYIFIWNKSTESNKICLFYRNVVMERHSKTRYDVEEVLQFVIVPGAESELSDFESSDEEDETLLLEKLTHETLAEDVIEEEELAGNDNESR